MNDLIIITSIAVILGLITFLMINPGKNIIFFGAKPQAPSKPKPQAPSKPKPQAPSKPKQQAPTTSRLQNAANFFQKNPKRVNNPPAAYKGLIQAGYLKKQGSNWSVNTKPQGQQPARKQPTSSGGSGYKPGSSGGSGYKPGSSGGSGYKPGSSGGSGYKPGSSGGSGGSGSGGYKKPPSGGVSNMGWSNDNSAAHTKPKDKHVIVNTAGDSKAEAAKKVADLKKQGKYVDGYLNVGRITPNEHKQMYDDVKKGLAAIGKTVGEVTRDPGDRWARENKERWITPQAMADPKVRAVFEKAWAAEIQRMGQAGFNAVNVDNVDYYQKGNGLKREPTKAELAQATSIWGKLADNIHASGMAAGLKNAPEIAPQMASKYDFAVTEQMFQGGNKAWGVPLFNNFVQQGKPIYNFEVAVKYGGDVPKGWDAYNKGGSSGYQPIN